MCLALLLMSGWLHLPHERGIPRDRKLQFENEGKRQKGKEFGRFQANSAELPRKKMNVGMQVRPHQLLRKKDRFRILSLTDDHQVLKYQPSDDFNHLVAPNSFLYRTLGLEKYRFSTYISSSHPTLLPTLLLSLPFNPSHPTSAESDEYKLNDTTSLRRISNNELFLLTDDPGVDQDTKDVDRIQNLIQGCGHHLIKLYFRIVHPSFPILHKGLFLEKFYRSIYEISPPLLAAVYLLALNWRNYSPTSLAVIDEKALSDIAQSTWSAILSRPRLSTVQAGLLLLQRRQIEGGIISDGPGVGAFVGELCAVGRVLGLHLDCTNWRVPVWERGLRRRLGWGLWMCDKW